jgi:hypothetical protein
MEEKPIVATVGAVPGTSIGKSLELEFVNVIFRASRSAEYQGKVCKATIKEPAWLSKLEPSAPLDGYLFEHGEFSASFAKDDRITTGLKVTIELNCS